MIDSAKTQLFEQTPIPRATAVLAVPTILSSLVMVLYNLADTYFVGLLNDPIQNAAVTLSAPVLLAFNAINNLFGVGASSMLSRALGKKDYDTAARSSAFGIYCALVCAALFSLFYAAFQGRILYLLGARAETLAPTAEYLRWAAAFGAAPSILNVVMAYMARAEGASSQAGAGVMTGCLLNIALDPFFILPRWLNMGAAGAGCATFAANCAACVYFFITLALRRGKTLISLRPAMAKPRRDIALGVCAVGVPASIQNILNVTGMTALNNAASAFGSAAVAAMGISYKINMIPMYIAMGLSQGIMPLVGYTFASGAIKRMKNAVGFSMRIAIIFLTLTAASYYVFARGLISIFIKTPTVVAYGARFLRAMCLSLPFLCFDFVAVGVFQACGMGKKSLIFAVLRKPVLEIPALYVLNALFPLYGLAYAQFAAEFVLSIAAAVVLSRLFKSLSAA